VNGTLSVLKKAEYQTITRNDFNVSPTPNKVPVELVMDGELLYKNLTGPSYTDEWLLTELKKRNIQVSDIAYAVVGTKGRLYIDLFEDSLRQQT